MNFENFYDIAVYASEHWRGKFSAKEIACTAYDYMISFQCSKSGQVDHVIQQLLDNLSEDAHNGGEEAGEWVKEIIAALEEKKSEPSMESADCDYEYAEYAVFVWNIRAEKYEQAMGAADSKSLAIMRYLEAKRDWAPSNYDPENFIVKRCQRIVSYSDWEIVGET